MFPRALSRSVLVHLFLVALLLEGTPDILARESATGALRQMSLERGATVQQSVGPLPAGRSPGVDELSAHALQVAPALSGANPPYPANHVLDSNPQPVEVPIPNQDFETPGYEVGAPPANHGFATGDLTGWSTAGTVTIATTTGGDDYAQLSGSGAAIVSSPFAVTTDAQYGTLRMGGLSSGSAQFAVYVLSGTDFAASTQVLAGVQPDQWQTRQFNIVAWRGQQIKLQVNRTSGTLGVDDAGIQTVGITGWEVTGDAVRTPAADGTFFVSTNGRLTSQTVTLPDDIQHLTLQYRRAQTLGSFYVELLRGENFDQVASLNYIVPQDYTNWTTDAIGVQIYAGETVKLRIRTYIGRIQVDNVGFGEKVLPGWSLRSHVPLVMGEDQYGAYATTGSNGAVTIQSSTMASGIIDHSADVQSRYFSVSYDIDDVGSRLFRVFWYNSATGEDWPVFTDSSGSPTGPRTRYFPIYEFMGDEGYFSVLIPTLGKLYSIADNIPRKHLSEPFSQKVGLKIDTSTGSFGYDETDITTQGTLPLSFSRYYAGHFDRPGEMGYGWSHSYQTRLEITEGGDAGVVFGSGRQVFFEWITSTVHGDRFRATDVRVHDTLVKNSDGTFTFTTATNLSYHFDAAGTLLSVADLNGNTISFAYNLDGQLSAVTGLGGQTITFSYDVDGRLNTVTDPVNAVWTYGYDTSGDLTNVTDPEGGVRTYHYDKHRLSQVINPLGDTLFSNSFDSLHRVISQTDAEGKTISIDYETPGKGATEVTDPEGNSATYYFDNAQRTTDMLDPQGQLISRQYDSKGDLVRVIDPAFNEWDFAYNSGGDLTTHTDPLNQPITIAYNPQHLPTTITDARNNTTTVTYGANGNVATSTDPLNTTTSYTYDTQGNVLTETNPLNQTTTYTYNTAGNMLTKVDALTNTWSWTYNAAGRMTSETDPNGNTTQYVYDLFGRVVLVRDALLGETGYGYDFFGYLLWMDDPLNNRTSWAYNNRGLVESKTDPAGKVSTYTWSYPDLVDRSALAIEAYLRSTTSSPGSGFIHAAVSSCARRS